MDAGLLACVNTYSAALSYLAVVPAPIQRSISAVMAAAAAAAAAAEAAAIADRS